MSRTDQRCRAALEPSSIDTELSAHDFTGPRRIGCKDSTIHSSLSVALAVPAACCVLRQQRVQRRWRRRTVRAAERRGRRSARFRRTCSRRSASSAIRARSAPHGLRLDAANSYALLVGVPSDEQPAILRVKPSDPSQQLPDPEARGQRLRPASACRPGLPALPQATIDVDSSMDHGRRAARQAPGTGPIRVTSLSPLPARRDRVATGDDHGGFRSRAQRDDRRRDDVPARAQRRRSDLRQRQRRRDHARVGDRACREPALAPS